MAFLTLNGTDVKVRTDNASEAEPTYLGESARAFDGSYRSGVRAKKRTWTFTLASMLPDDYDAIVTLIGLEATITATGAAFNGETITCVARIGATPFTPDGLVFRRGVTLTLIEK